jgi:4-hydroxy-tetrahydrodipicolinate reductase
MKIGLVGFGKTGKAVASVLINEEALKLEWVLRRNPAGNKEPHFQFMETGLKKPQLVFSKDNITISELLEKYPVDCIVDFSSSEGIYYYGEAAAQRKIKIVSAISHYGPRELELLKYLSEKTAVFWSPNITVGVNFLLLASKCLKRIAPYADIEIVEEHFKKKSGVSGTALKIADALDLEKESINSIRAGNIVGKHEVIFGFPYRQCGLLTNLFPAKLSAKG